ncbi:MAG TPA: hypothetical protein VF070_41440 [Streptosporangiaceae bacterium]
MYPRPQLTGHVNMTAEPQPHLGPVLDRVQPFLVEVRSGITQRPALRHSLEHGASPQAQRTPQGVVSGLQMTGSEQVPAFSGEFGEHQ